MAKVNKAVWSVADCLATLTLTQVKTDNDTRSTGIFRHEGELLDSNVFLLSVTVVRVLVRKNILFYLVCKQGQK